MANFFPNLVPSSATRTVPGLAAASDDGGVALAGLVAEMGRRWATGERPPVEEFLARYPELGRQTGAALKLIYEDFCLRRRHGEKTDPSSYFRRFPQWQSQLEALLTTPPHPAEESGIGLPRVGERLGDFELLGELGRGAVGCVFLARQTALADRLVVLKVTPCDGHEHLSLARLQHTHVVPLYSAQQDETRGLRVLCMPYFGGATLAALLSDLQTVPPEQRSGRRLVEALDRAGAERPVHGADRGSARQLLASVGYEKAVCWLGACLADALDYAHQRGLVHLDLKPSNILLAADGTPMLLDFHLAQAPLQAGAPPPIVGGTLAYMPREQHEAMTAVRANRPLTQALDGRADLFALGATLYAALGGRVPVRPGDSPPLHVLNRAVPVGLSDVVRKCLAPEAADRYASAALLAADLRRHLADLPLKGVANRCLRERWRKWRRRKPHTFALAVMLLSVLGAALAVGLNILSHFGQQRDRARAALEEGQEASREGDFTRAVQTFQRGVRDAEAVPFESDLARQLHEKLVRARADEAGHAQQKLLTEFHALVDTIRFRYGTDSLSPGDAHAIADKCKTVWGRRQKIVAGLGGREKAGPDLLDLAILWTDLHVRLAPPGEVAGRHRTALAVLTEAERLLGPSHVLCRERQAHAQALGLVAEAEAAGRRAEALPPRTAWDFYALGLMLRRQQTLLCVPSWNAPAPGHAGALLGMANQVAAEAVLRRAVALQPGGLWPNFYLGRSAYHLGRYHDAVAALSVCIGVAPRTGSLYLNRALIYAALGESEQAASDFAQACKLNPHHASSKEAVAHNLTLALPRGERRERALRTLEAALRDSAGERSPQ